MGYEAEACIRSGSVCDFGKTKGSNVRRFWYVVAAIVVFMMMMYGVGSCFGCEACFACAACVDEDCDGGCDLEECGRDCYEEGCVYGCKYDCEHDEVSLYYPGHDTITEEVTSDRKDFSEWIWRYEYNSTYFTFNGATDDSGKQFINTSGQRVKDFDKVSGKLTFHYSEKNEGMSYIVHFGSEDIYYPVSVTVGEAFDELPEGERPTQDGRVCTGWATPNGTKVAYYDNFGQFKWSGSEFHLYNWSVSPDSDYDIYLTPVYEIVKFTVTFVGQNGTTASVAEVEYDSLVQQIILNNENVQRLETNVQFARFIGWGLNANPTEADKIDLSSYRIKGNVTFYIVLEEHVTLRFYLNNGTDQCYIVERIKVGNTHTLPTLSEAFPGVNEVDLKPGYTFKGWYYSQTADASSTQPLTGTIRIEKKNASNYVDFYGGYTGRKYTVDYYDGDIFLWNTVYSKGDELALPTAGDLNYKEGYRFVGWCENEALTGTPITNLTANDYGDKKFYAKYQASEFVVTLNTRLPNASFLTQQYRLLYGQKTRLPVPTISDNTIEFYWWKYNDKALTDEYGNLLEPFTFDSLGLSISGSEEEDQYRNSLEFFAEWNEKRLIVTYSYDGQTKTERVKNGELAQGISTPEKTGYTFTGWYQDSGCTQPYDFNTAVESNIDLYAGFIGNEYNVTLNADGGIVNGSAQAILQVTYDEQYVSLTDYVPTQTDYKFLGWYYVDGTTETKYIDENGNFVRKFNFTKDVEFVAKWERTTYHIAYYPENGEVAQTIDWQKGSSSTSYIPTKSGSFFYGWFTARSGGTQIFYRDGRLACSEADLLALADENGCITLYAQW